MGTLVGRRWGQVGGGDRTDWQTLPGVTQSEGGVKEYKHTVGKIDWCNTECKRCNTEIGKGVTQSERGVTQRRCQRVRAYGRSPPSST